ncbi:cytochrome c biogenesis CcdA family protein [Desulfotalea psychrophila]|uniref:Hypothetical membrane protein n=1 Tax=Desulfotalea psychrophila (strain LSv54 / DSM 12343) TaxID=177439 RepID=Q6AIK2_DESPS|nr:cytochrome c biogenesis protein CcdA [Desulfotalea psychrophila]CAG37828.1 hypothetical membrane protein [Desulfotalea psychrophila LSv54]
MGLQVLASEGLTFLATHLQVGYAFGAGMVSAVNPCGFVMLPVYVSLYIGATEDDYASRSFLYKILRAIGVALVLTLGFASLFGVVGFAIAYGGSYLLSFTPWIALIVGFLLMFLGLWLLLGKHVSLPFMLRLANRIGDPRKISVLGFYLFGVAYGAASTSCTLPIFLAVVMNSVATDNLAGAFAQFIIYICGVFFVLASLTMGMVVLKQGAMEKFFRRVFPYVQTISALFLLIAGGYIIYYWLTSGLLFANV